MTEAAHAVFVLVAGGLGERLGFEGIKVSLPSDLLSGKPFLQLYAENILSLQAKGREASNNPDLKLPLAIMTSGDTHERTIKLLEENNYFGLDADQVTLIQQEKVPAIMDRTGSIAVDPEDPYTVLTKPHGHGDVHTLLHQSGLASKWASEGRRWIMFFQDTNGLIFQAAPALIGVSESLGLQINTLTVPRRPGEAVGSICHLKHQETGQELTINVEYNQLEPLLKSTVSPEGDVPDKSGFSPYPGNTNALVFRVEPYAKVLKETGGKMPEFVNPKFKDESKTAFKKPTRLECMMQDYPRLLGRDAKVGFTQLERWSCFAAVKNNAVDAAAQHKKTGFAESASTAESAIYRMFRQKLQLLGVHVAEPTQEVFNGVPTWVGPKVILSPSFASTFEEMGRKFLAPESVQISKDSTLHLDGRDIEIKSLDLDGSLSVTAVPGARVVIDGKVKNTPWQFTPVDADDKTIPEPLRIRGYDMDKSSKDHVYVFDKPGTYTIP
uniref:UTP-monosaccharide-1-phosphate uridylyltransferase n=1 Tax=Lotharella oceanica TaxID=641309 RepID=A0A7S2XAT1_9EUKA|mmetsp:Transcript_22206/g.41625  ORF Transcript_22206/g.41625 Transcript_22206/m.41625 type:complete len:496 (+) Transcript_22206:3-1490(+)